MLMLLLMPHVLMFIILLWLKLVLPSLDLLLWLLLLLFRNNVQSYKSIDKRQAFEFKMSTLPVHFPANCVYIMTRLAFSFFPCTIDATAALPSADASTTKEAPFTK